MKHQFEGNTAECLRHYSANIPKNVKGCVDARRTLTLFTGASNSTVRRWANGEMPKGAYLLKLRYFLRSLGYSVSELESLSPTVASFGELLAFEVVDLKEATRILNYHNHDQILSIVLRHQGTTKESVMQEMLANNAEGLAKKKAEFRQQLGEQITATGAPAHDKSRDLSREEIVRSLAFQVKAMAPIAEALASDRYTPEERKRLRLLAGDDVFKLSTSLNRLCSETAYRQFTLQPSQKP